jgi:hypothetical protein
MAKEFTPSRLSFSDREQLQLAVRRLKVNVLRIERALADEKNLPPPWARAAIIKTSIGVARVAQMVSPKQGKKAPPPGKKK